MSRARQSNEGLTEEEDDISPTCQAGEFISKYSVAVLLDAILCDW